MTAQEILNKFHLYIDDNSEMSSDDELDLLNKVYDDLMTDRTWEFLKKTATGSILTDSIGSYITLPSDFRYMAENNQTTNNADSTDNNASQKVVFVGSSYTPYQMINFSDRRQYRNSGGYCYVSLSEGKIRFTATPIDTTYEFDYIYKWPALDISATPVFPSEFHHILYHLMAVDSVIINLFDRAHSYAVENFNSADDIKKKMILYNSLQTFN